MKPIYDKYLDDFREGESGGGGELPPATQPGTTIAYNGAEWEARYGEKHVTVTGDFVGENGYLYVLNLENDMTVRIGAVNSLEDYTFDVLVFQGAVVRQLTLLGNHNPIWWAAGDWYPQSYSSENTPPAMDEANTGYFVHFTWSSDARVFLAEVSKTFAATRGVVVDSAGILVTSAMTYTGGTIGVGEVANHVTVYNRGIATGQTVVSGGGVYVSGGGIASNTNIVHANGQLQVYVGGVAVSPTVDSGTLSVERGTVDGIVANGGNVNATSNAIISGGTITQSGNVTVTESEINDVQVGGTLTVSSGGVATSATINNGGSMTVSSGGVANDLRTSGMVTISSGGVINNATILLGGTVAVYDGLVDGGYMAGAGRISVNSGGVVESVSLIAGFVVINSGGVAKTAIASAGYVIASNGGVASDTVLSVYTVAGSGLVRGGRFSGTTVSNGGQLHVSAGSATDTTVSSGGKMYVSSGGSADVAHIVSGGLMHISSGGIASHFSSVDGATVEVLSGGSATTAGTAYGVSVENGGSLTVESGGVANSASVSGYVYVSSGGVMSGGTVASATGGGVARIYIYSDAEVTGLVASRGGQIIMSGGVATEPVINSSGFLTVSSGAAALDVTSSAGAVVTVLEGGTITYK